MSSDNRRVHLWNLWRKRRPGRKTVCGDPNTKGTTILDLPEDVIVNILLRLPVKSLCRVQCVSKTSFDIARSPGFATLHTLGLLDSAIDSDIFKFPQLILLTASNRKYKNLMTLQSLEYNSDKYKLTKTRQSALVSKICFGNTTSYYELEFVYCNLLCFYVGYGFPRLLVNPLRGEILKLPFRDNIFSIYAWCGMGFDPMTNTYKIVKISASDKENCSSLMAQILVLGTSSWRNKPLVSSSHSSSVFLGGTSCKKTVYIRGYMHRLIRENDGSSYIISFDFSKEELHEIPAPDLSGFFDPDKPWMSEYYCDSKLLNLRGSLAIVDFCLSNTNRRDYIDIWVLKSYEKKGWELRHRIKTDELKLNVGLHIHVVLAETCVQWEHGICFASRTTCYFLDLRQLSMTIVELPTVSPKAPSISSNEYWTTPRYTTSSIFGYTETLISLKNYGSVIKATKSKEGEWHID